MCCQLGGLVVRMGTVAVYCLLVEPQRAEGISCVVSFPI